MIASEIAAELCKRANQLGLDNPTESMIADRIGDLESEILKKLEYELCDAGFEKTADLVTSVYYGEFKGGDDE